ncbi:unnamed protein product [Effrenium voratum]|uniref:Uncharacterized protein n=1 Tax=Effrenium voratum TaxID=2562239 RepID=A0AA36MJ33_9DINO|nr:unnamed protein product [Effrenium voratum]
MLCWAEMSKEVDNAAAAAQLLEEEVRGGMARRSGRRLRPTSPENMLRLDDGNSSQLHALDDLRVEKRLPTRGAKKDWNRNSSRVAEVFSAQEQPDRAAGAKSELWAPWLLHYEKELHEQRERLQKCREGERPAVPPLPFLGRLHLTGGSVNDVTMRRGRSQEPSCGAGKPTSKPEGPGPPFWLGGGQGVTPESTSQAQFRSASARRVPKAKASRREASHEERESRGEPRLGSKPKTAQAVASPSRFGDNPRSLQEQVAQESFLHPSVAAGKPTSFDHQRALCGHGATWTHEKVSGSRSSAFPRSLSPPSSFSAK